MNPKPRFFQIHLSTAVVLMLVAGVLVWANARQEVVPEAPTSQLRAWQPASAYAWSFYGWPYRGLKILHRDDGHSGNPNIVVVRVWAKTDTVYNSLIALAILASVCVACEWRIRRRIARKANE